MRLDRQSNTSEATMNYIKRLERENKELKRRLEKIENQYYDVAKYLLSDKFQGIDSRDGSLNNWVSVPDILYRLEGIHSTAING